MRHSGIAVVVVALLLSGGALFAPVNAPAVAGASDAEPLAEIAWIGRAWRAERDGTIIEEIWSPADGGCMTGMFRLVAGGQPRFYEFMSIEAKADGIFLHMHHFSPGLKRWEDTPLLWELIETTSEHATFEVRNQPEPKKLIFMKQGDDGIIIRLHDFEDGKPVNQEFAMQAVN